MFFISSINKTKYDYIAKPFSKEQIKEKLDIVFGPSEEEATITESVPKYDPNVDRFKGTEAYVFGVEDKNDTVE